MLFKEGSALYAFEVQREAGEDVLYVNYLGSPLAPNLAESADVMARTVELLIGNPNITKLIFVQQRNYCYDFKQISLLQEIAQLYVYLTKQERILAPEKLALSEQTVGRKYSIVSYLLNLLKSDAVACYSELRRILREERINF